MRNYLSCDSYQDAIRSLSIFYGVDYAAIANMVEHNWPAVLPSSVEYCEFLDERLHFIFMSYLGIANFPDAMFDVAFYHRTRFDGHEGWFDQGVLNAQDGVVAFFKKIEPELSIYSWFDLVRSRSIANVIDRNRCEINRGPHAYDTFFDAAYGQGRSNFDVPEFALTSAGFCVEEFVVFCRERLKPVIVKFLAKPVSLSRYILSLWFFVFREKFGLEGDPLYFNFYGGGACVPNEKIVELIIDFDLRARRLG